MGLPFKSSWGNKNERENFFLKNCHDVNVRLGVEITLMHRLLVNIAGGSLFVGLLDKH